MSSISSYKDLLIWKKGIVIVVKVYQLTKAFPSEELYTLTSQIKRASVSIPSNIAEGSSINSNKDFSRFLEIAIGSAYEIETQLLISSDLGFLKDDKLKDLSIQLEEIIKMTSKFRSTLKI